LVTSSSHFSFATFLHSGGSAAPLQLSRVVIVTDVVGTHEPQNTGQTRRIFAALIPLVQRATPCKSPWHSAGSAAPLHTGVVVVTVVVVVVAVAVVVVAVAVVAVPVVVV
jgi:hypothetical protein